MTEQILNLIADYGLETVCIALCVNLFTGIVKLPVKAIADKTKKGTRITRFIVFMPILFGFVFTLLYFLYIIRSPLFGKQFITLWLTSSSLSLTFYAIFEKLFPKKSQSPSREEIEESRELIKKIGGIAMDIADIENRADNETECGKSCGKIILAGKKNAENEVEKK